MGQPKVKTRYKGGVLEDRLNRSPVDVWQRRARTRFWLIFLGILILIAVWFVWRFFSSSPRTFQEVTTHFKYGSIGSEPGGSITTPVGGALRRHADRTGALAVSTAAERAAR